MTTEDDFQSKLDADPTDWQTRLVLADYLDERDDRRAAGYRALGQLRLRPYSWVSALKGNPSKVVFGFHNGHGVEFGTKIRLGLLTALPAPWFERCEPNGAYWRYDRVGRRSLEDDVTRAFHRLRADVQARILTVGLRSLDLYLRLNPCATSLSPVAPGSLAVALHMPFGK